MAFCTNCGHQLANDAKFCFECGAKVAIPAADEEHRRKIRFDGEIHKCPHCGEVLNSFESVCPTCNYELRGLKSSGAVKELSQKLENALSERQRIVIIKNFPVPNTKEDIFEFMLLAASNFDASYYVSHMDEDDISDAWLAKIEQCYSKARLAFGNHDDYEKIESIYLKIKHECAERENNLKDERRIQKQALEGKESAKEFKKSKMSKILIVFAVISVVFGAVAFNDGKILAGIISITMLALVIVAFLMGSNVIREKVKNIRLIPMILALVLIVPYFGAYDMTIDDTNRHAKYEWPSEGISQYLPNPPTQFGVIQTDDEKRFSIDLYQVSQAAFDDYTKACKQKGFTIGVTKTDDVFYAYNSEEYDLSIFYWEDKRELSVYLDAPMQMSTVKWPESDLGKKAPKPESLLGKIEWENSEHFGVYIANMNADQYSAYVDQCIAAGFNIDYSRDEKRFSAYDADGYHLVVEKRLFDKIYISIKIPER